MFLTYKYLRETRFAEFAWVSPENLNWSDPDIARGANQLKYCCGVNLEVNKC
ncbi:MAG: hypothetical protein MGU50_21920 [Trichodesmium sp. MAG_R02]|nr:hypothetical protein [Trichodesmium sp. MAG_R02]